MKVHKITLTPKPCAFKQFPIMSNNLTKREIVQNIYESANYNHKDVTEIVQKTLDNINKALTSGMNVELRNFGVFEVQVRKSRVGRNPNKPETDVVIPRRAVVKFKAGKEMKTGLTKLDLDNF
ncbi:integration host factor subunit beta [Opitutales bacterium]|jgi:nucleoid DNA-binding protein|nr:integration host factor subunit beta [Opitutales bacterium]MDA8991143.1 integration host factor subunit beta [Opitutales bacterium]